jgi:16S rRNA (uracil1498-N3)-methyltransferase
MARRRWIADEVSGDRAALTGTHADHLIRVLRTRLGEEFDIVSGSLVRRGIVARIGEQRVEFDLAEQVHTPPPAPIGLFLAIFKFDRMEWAIEKATELGVARILPVIAARTDAHLASAAVKRVDRWRKIALQASEQSRRSAPPEIRDPIRFREAATVPAETRIVLSESEAATQLRDAFRQRNGEADVLLALGPEGGWTEDELGQFQKQGWRSASLGPTILRAETAAIAAVAIAVSELAG